MVSREINPNNMPSAANISPLTGKERRLFADALLRINPIAIVDAIRLRALWSRWCRRARRRPRPEIDGRRGLRSRSSLIVSARLRPRHLRRDRLRELADDGGEASHLL